MDHDGNGDELPPFDGDDDNKSSDLPDMRGLAEDSLLDLVDEEIIDSQVVDKFHVETLTELLRSPPSKETSLGLTRVATTPGVNPYNGSLLNSDTTR